MRFKELENTGLIRETKINFKQIYNFLSRSRQDLKTAKSNLIIDEAWSYAIADAEALVKQIWIIVKNKDSQKNLKEGHKK
jgi:hypothetical protein